MLRSFSAFILICVYAARGYAQDSVNTYEPADFPEDQSSITRRIKFPDYAQDLFVQVFCEVSLTRSGHFERSLCFTTDPAAEVFADAIVKRIDATVLEPAKVNGRAEPIWFQYTVQFEKKSGVESIKLFAHHFHGIEGPGDGYTGPQRYDAPITASCVYPYNFWYNMLIPVEGGKPTDVTLLNPEENLPCEARIRGSVEAGMYIPAFLHGVAVAAPYREMWSGLGMPSVPPSVPTRQGQ